MPAPVSPDQLFAHLRKSGLIPPVRLDEFLAQSPDGETPRVVLARLTDAGLLTPFQSERIATGKYKGFVMGGYVILDRIGGGGTGQVYLAEHAAMRRHVALKVLSLAQTGDPVARERFFREARAAAALNHPNIVRVYDLRTEGQVLYLVMEYAPGASLQHVVARGGPLAPAAAAGYARNVALGLQHAHENELVHRDIKPANLLLTANGQVKILDLGLVRTTSDSSKLTDKIDRAILGTADYLAPEQAVNSSTVDIRADLYSLGATIHFLLVGKTIFPDGRTAQKLMWQQLKEPQALRELRPDVPEGLAAIVAKALRKKPEERFQSPMEMADALARFADPNTPPPPPDLMPGPPPRWNGVPKVGTASSTALKSAADTGSGVAWPTPPDNRDLLPGLSAAKVGTGSHLIDFRKFDGGIPPSQTGTLTASTFDLLCETPNNLRHETRNPGAAPGGLSRTTAALLAVVVLLLAAVAVLAVIAFRK